MIAVQTEYEFITPPDGIAIGEHVQREIPLIGTYAIRQRKNALDRALGVFFRDLSWCVYLDGFLVAPPSANWKEAFGHLWSRAERMCFPITGRSITSDEYHHLIKTRASDSKNGIDLSGSVDLNQVKPLF